MPCLVALTDKGLFLFRFGCKGDMDWTLSAHPLSIGNKRIHLAPWHPGMEDLPILKSAAVWICLRNIPYHLWCKQILFSLARTIGKPIRMDEFTASQKLLSYARILVEVDLSKPLPNCIRMDLEETKPVAINIEFENLP